METDHEWCVRVTNQVIERAIREVVDEFGGKVNERVLRKITRAVAGSMAGVSAKTAATLRGIGEERCMVELLPGRKAVIRAELAKAFPERAPN